MTALLDDLRRRADGLTRILPKKKSGQCLAEAVAVMIRQPAWKMPLRYEDQDVDEWSREVEEMFGVRFRYLEADECDPPPPGVWVAIVPSAKVGSTDTHALPMLGTRALKDADLYFGRAYELVICAITLEEESPLKLASVTRPDAKAAQAATPSGAGALRPGALLMRGSS